ncbi:energy-coupling factor transporter transmembrane component T family protein [Desulforamulus aquiferis]|uniref:Energy-coupling factor transporter transmembrane component T n=1 Tax=Desulforamulus aquiferis TaxID=1397668 RepID=A0AAW7ZI72_9FIRM|nr:energy-coupling factor transporter transmembrane component T [Desulforamulus aquiferis]MDO7788893.1 energy-coupling factor transporter transmembrane component T [Desulforamulus aquiferis]
MSLFSNITIGQYYPGNSLVHRLDPRAKLLTVPIIAAAALLSNGMVGYLTVAIPVIIALLIAQIPLGAFLRGMKFLWIILTISFVLHAISHPGEIIWEWSLFTVTREGLINGLRLIYRLTLLIVTGMLLTMTTTPVNLTGGLERLLTPFKKVGIPAHELAMMMTIALRFVPTLLEEAEAITRAQQARGGSITTGSFSSRVRASVALLVPMLAGSLRRAEELATAMEARCYRGDVKRTSLKQFTYTSRDYTVFILAISTLIIVGVDRWILF